MLLLKMFFYTFSHFYYLYLSENLLFYTFFYLLLKQLSYLHIVFQQILACQLIILFDFIILLLEINSFSLFNIYNSLGSSLDLFVYKYLLTKKLKNIK